MSGNVHFLPYQLVVPINVPQGKGCWYLVLPAIHSTQMSHQATHWINSQLGFSDPLLLNLKATGQQMPLHLPISAHGEITLDIKVAFKSPQSIHHTRILFYNSIKLCICEWCILCGDWQSIVSHSPPDGVEEYSKNFCCLRSSESALNEDHLPMKPWTTNMYPVCCSGDVQFLCIWFGSTWSILRHLRDCLTTSHAWSTFASNSPRCTSSRQMTKPSTTSKNILLPSWRVVRSVALLKGTHKFNSIWSCDQ